MPTVHLRYTGLLPRSEADITGIGKRWWPGEIRSLDAGTRVNALVAANKGWKLERGADVPDLVRVQALVSVAVILAESRPALASDSGATLELSAGVTYTLTDAVSLPAGVVLIGPASGTATIACTGSATINGATSSITVSAGQVYSVIPRASVASAYIAKGS